MAGRPSASLNHRRQPLPILALPHEPGASAPQSAARLYEKTQRFVQKPRPSGTLTNAARRAYPNQPTVADGRHAITRSTPASSQQHRARVDTPAIENVLAYTKVAR